MNKDYLNDLNFAVIGAKKLAESRLVICMCCRNVGKRLERTLQFIDVLRSIAKECAVIIYENDSTDSTKDILKIWKDTQEGKKTHIISTQLGTQSFGQEKSRKLINLMSQIRNQCLMFVKNYYAHWDYMLVLDSDLQAMSLDGVMGSFAHQNWDVISANGLLELPNNILLYYDIWALIEKGSQSYFRGQTKESYRSSSGLIEVEAAFGGLAIYKISPELMKCSYHPQDLKDDKYKETDPRYNNDLFGPEHTGFHFDMRKQGLNRHYINSNMMLFR